MGGCYLGLSFQMRKAIRRYIDMACQYIIVLCVVGR